MIIFSFLLSCLLHGTVVASLSLRESQQSNGNHRIMFETLGIDYSPLTLVTDHAAIAFDHSMIEALLKAGTINLGLAQDVYERGVSSMSYAELTLEEPLATALEKGTLVMGTSVNGTQARGTLMEPYSDGSQVIKVVYEVSDVQDSYVNCRVGGAPEPYMILEGCFQNNGTIAIHGASEFEYSYDNKLHNKNGRTFQGFSTQAGEVLMNYPLFQKFNNYYGYTDYADRIMEAGFATGKTDLKNGNIDFTGFSALGEEHGEVIRKTIVTLHLAMWAVGKLEQAVETCTSGCTAMDCYEESVYSWDQAVAFYSGTNPGDKLPFHDADKYCKYFGTCGEDRELMEGTAQVNHKLMDYFKEGQTSIVNGDCQSALQMKEQIEALMTVPNIQGTLRNIWKGYENMEKGEVHKVEKHRGEAIAYTAALLPLVHDCNAKDAEIIHDYIFTADLDLDSYKAVKEALERNYECMKVQCADVGGFTGKESDEYKDFHIPCNVQQASSSPNAVKLGFGIGVAVGVAVLSLL